MMTQAQPTIVSGAMSTVADLGKDERWLQDWLKESPSRLGLGALEVADGEPVQDEDGNPAFLATDDDRYFSVDVQLDEMDASHGFQVLDNWARNRVRHPDKTHVAVLVTETASDRYRTTLETLAEHLPLVVVELSVWRGQHEAIVVPRVALSSDDVDVASMQVAETATVGQASEGDVEEVDASEAVAGNEDGGDGDPSADDSEDETVEAEDNIAVGSTTADPETGVDDPWRLPKSDGDSTTRDETGSLATVSGG